MEIKKEIPYYKGVLKLSIFEKFCPHYFILQNTKFYNSDPLATSSTLRQMGQLHVFYALLLEPRPADKQNNLQKRRVVYYKKIINNGHHVKFYKCVATLYLLIMRRKKNVTLHQIYFRTF